MPHPHPDFLPCQQICPRMVRSWADNFDFSAQDPPHQDPNERNSIRDVYCLGGKHTPQLTADILTMMSISSAVAPAVASLCKHHRANDLIRGQHNALPHPLPFLSPQTPLLVNNAPQTDTISRRGFNSSYSALLICNHPAICCSFDGHQLIVALQALAADAAAPLQAARYGSSLGGSNTCNT
jgi:hypothetical protein